jgi:hypothetical protein
MLTSYVMCAAAAACVKLVYKQLTMLIDETERSVGAEEP